MNLSQYNKDTVVYFEDVRKVHQLCHSCTSSSVIFACLRLQLSGHQMQVVIIAVRPERVWRGFIPRVQQGVAGSR